MKKINCPLWGSEPQFNTLATSDLEVIKAFNWYNNFYDADNSKKWISEWMKAHYNSENIQNFIRNCPDRIPSHISALCRMLSRGASLDTKYENKIHQFISNNTSIPSKTVVADRPERKNKKVEKVIAEFDDCLDQVYLSDYKNVAKPTISISHLNSKEIEEVTSYYSEIQKFYLDNQESEEFDHLTCKNKRNVYCNSLNNIMDLLSKKTIVRRPRKAPSKKKPEAILRKFRYLVRDENLKISSISSKELLGASTCVLYNIKYKKIFWITSSNASGFSVKGTTITNIDEKNSYCKIVRKPNEFISKINNCTKIATRKAIEELTTSSKTVNGRCSNDTLILKVY